MIELTTNTEQLYEYYQEKLEETTPFFHAVTKSIWNISFFKDTDYEGVLKFKELKTVVARKNNQIEGFIQFGLSNYSYDNNGAKDFSNSMAVIRQLYFSEDKVEVGQALIDEALAYFQEKKYTKYYAFFHALGMSFTATHGKLYQDFSYIESLLFDNKFKTEHENVYYKRELKAYSDFKTDITLKHQNEAEFQTETITFYLDNEIIGQGNIFYLPDKNHVYLRWVYLIEAFQNKGYGSQVMQLLSNYLYEQNYTELHTDTADNNLAAQHYYLKNRFIDLGRTRSYLT